MNNSCELHAVVVGSDPAVVDSILPSLNELGIAPAVYTQPAAAIQTLSREKIDAFFVDREIDPELSVLKRMRTSPSSHAAVGFAIVRARESVAEASRVADFVIDKPLAPVHISRAVRAGYGIMLKERKRYFRRSLSVPIHLTDSSFRRFVGQTINVSQTGIAVECAAPFSVREIVQLEFCLPDSSDGVNCKAQLIWRAEQGKAGLSFTSIKTADRERLADWIEEEFHLLQQVPPVKAPGGWSRHGSAFTI
jgi:hypothetical protein